MPKRATKRQRGTVLIAVLWGVFVLTAMAFALSTLVRSGTEELRARKEHLQAYYIARGAIYKTVPLLTAAPVTADAPFKPGQHSLAWQEEPVSVRVEIADENGKIDLNSARDAVLQKLFTNLGMDVVAARALGAAIGDWRDADNDTRLNGAEEMYYRSLPQPYRPANEDFRSVEELLLVRGVTPELFWGKYVVGEDGAVQRRWGLVDCLTVNAYQSAININYAPLPVLLAAPQMDERVAGWIVAGRQKKPFESVGQFVHDYPVLLGGETLGALTTTSSGRYTLVAAATMPSGITARVRAVVQVTGLSTPATTQQVAVPNGAGGFTYENQVVTPARQGPPFWVLEWNDSYVQ